MIVELHPNSSNVITREDFVSIMIVELMELHPNSCHSGKPSSATEARRSL